ncbi:MAG: hypothetical protein Q9162_003186 [Coniocarpon cinnabarinum]
MSSQDQSNSNEQPPEGYYAWLKHKGGEYYQSGSDYAGHQWENYKPWLEDQYLKWFTNHNKTSYATEDTLNKTQVFDDKGLLSPLGKAQKGVNQGVAEQFGQGGALEGVGNMTSKEGINRAERGGKDESGSYIPSMSGTASGAADYGKGAASGLGNAASGLGNAAGGAADAGKNAAGGAAEAGQNAAGGAASAGQSAVGSVGGALGSVGGVLGSSNSGQEQSSGESGKQ